MSEAAHRIRDELLELRADDPTLARGLLERVSLLHRRSLVAIIDRVCSQLSPGDRLHRIDTLELELGSIDADELEAEFVRRFEPALQQALARAIRELDEREAAAGPSARGSAIELLELFLTTGNLPWWADRSRRDLVATQLAEAAEKSPRALQLLLERAVGSTRPEQLRRLVHHLDDDGLAVVLEVLAPSGAGALVVVARALVQVMQTLAAGQPHTRAVVWRSVLQVVGASGHGSRPLDELVDGVLHELARELDVRALPARAPPEAVAPGIAEDRLQLCAELVEAIERGAHDCPALLRDALERSVLGAHPPGPHPPGPGSLAQREHASATPEHMQPADEVAASVAAETETETETETAAHDELERWLDSWREGPLRELATALRAGSHARPAAHDSHTSIEQLGRLTELALREGTLSTATLRRSLAQLPTLVDTELAARLEQALLHAIERAALRGREDLQPPPQPATQPARLPDRLHVGDAGCVIAWPFLDRLFTRLELVERQAFVSPSAAARGVALLHVLASEDPEAPEYELPLAKLLCGLSPQTPVELDRPLEPAELQECEHMLAALIAHATILRDMSVADLRLNFLRREGLLGTRDDAWLLQVERRSHDLVLDRFPWTWTWVRLPWMSAPLRVEW